MIPAVILLYLIVGTIEAMALLDEGKKREVSLYIPIFTISAGISIAFLFNVKVTSAATIIERLLKPLIGIE